VRRRDFITLLGASAAAWPLAARAQQSGKIRPAIGIAGQTDAIDGYIAAGFIRLDATIMIKLTTKEDVALLVAEASEMFEETGCVPDVDGEKVPAETIVATCEAIHIGDNR
jgi:hypothetical protein